MKKIFIIFITLVNMGMLYSFTGFLNIGKTTQIFSNYPSNNYVSPYQFAETRKFGSCVAGGLELKLYKDYFITHGFIYRVFKFNKSELESIHQTDQYKIESYFNGSKKFGIENFSLYVGIQKHLSFNKISVKPEIRIGICSTNSSFSEIYFFDETDNMVHTKMYDFYDDGAIEYGWGLDLDYTFWDLKKIKCKLQLQTLFTYMAPTFKVNITETDLATNSITDYSEKYKDDIYTFYYGIGFSMDFNMDIFQDIFKLF